MTPGVVGALAVLTLRQCVRRKALFVLALFAAALAVFATVLPRHEPAAYFAALIEVSLTLISFFGILVAVFLAAAVLPDDRRHKTLSTLMTKPLGRLNYLLGRACGFALTLGIILAVMGVATWGVLRVAGAWAERRSGRADLVTAKRGIEPGEAFVRVAAAVKAVRPDDPGYTLAGRIDQQLVFGFRAGVGRLGAGSQRLEMLPNIATSGRMPRTDAWVTVENVATRKSQRFDVRLDGDRLASVTFPGDLVDPVMGCTVTLQRHEPGTYVHFARGAFQIMVAPMPFEWALAKALLMVFFAFVLVVAVSLAASTFLGAWVAMLLAFTAYFFAIFQNVLVDFMSGLKGDEAGLLGSRLYEHAHGAAEQHGDPFFVVVVNHVFYGATWVLTHVFPDFSRFDATSYLTAARDVPASAVGAAAAIMAGYAACYLALAYVIFHKRELLS